MINSSNYFEKSEGVFKMIPSTWVKKARENCTIKSAEKICPYTGEYLYEKETSQTEIKLGNHTWKPNFVSYNARYCSMSAYWVSEDGQYLLRISNHWSKAPKGVFACGNIRYCWWELTGRKQPGVNNLFGGIIKFSDLKERH